MSTVWIAAAGSGLIAGACLVGALVARPPWNLLFLALATGCAAAAAVASTSLAGEYGTVLATVAGMAFAAAAFLGGYRVAASAVLDILKKPHGELATDTGAAPARLAVILSDAEPTRYTPQHTAARLRRIERSGAARLTPSVVPMVFLAERMRYRAVRGPHPARYVVRAIAETLAERLARSPWPTHVAVAYVDGSPRLVDVLAASRPSSALVLELGQAGSLPFVEAWSETERQMPPVTTVQAVRPSVWRDHRLAQRLAERIADRVPEEERAATGVVLLGAGIPDEWRAASTRWAEDENYFLTRTAVLLQEAGFSQQIIKPAWIEWQTPALAEAVRHLAAVGCMRIVVAPATLIQPDLSLLIDLDRDVRDARIPEHIRITVLPPWGDDPVLIDVAASHLEDALSKSAYARQ